MKLWALLPLVLLACASRQSGPPGLAPAGCGRAWFLGTELGARIDLKAAASWANWKAEGVPLVTEDGDSIHVRLRQWAAERRGVTLVVTTYGRDLGEIDLYRQDKPCVYRAAKTAKGTLVFFWTNDPTAMEFWRQAEQARKAPKIDL